MLKRFLYVGLVGSSALAWTIWHTAPSASRPAPLAKPLQATPFSRISLIARTTARRELADGETVESSRGVQPAATLPKASPRQRAWDTSFFSELHSVRSGQSIRFELVDGESAEGTILQSRSEHNQVVFVSGTLVSPAAGRFFFQKQSERGVAGAFVGLVELPPEGKAYRIEPDRQTSAPELVERPLSEVRCTELPRSSVKERRPAAKTRMPKLGNFTNLPIAPYQQGIVAIESLHGAEAVVYLDFAGGYTPSWNGITYTRPQVSNDQIREVWERVAEDFLPFNINVTTDLGVYQNARQGHRQRVIVTPTDVASPEAGGAAYVGSFNWSGEMPCWVFMVSGKDCAEACSHEIGHTLGLSHDGQLIGGVNFPYFAGQGSGVTGWAPIMGLGYHENVSQWSAGEYLEANNPSDQLQIITTWNNDVTYRPDDTGDTLATARYLEIYSDSTAGAEGVIERRSDTDAFQFSTAGGLVSLRADPAGVGPNLAIKAALCDRNDAVLAESNPQDMLWASISTNLPAGTYTFRVTGAGRNDPLTNGFSNYGSLGYYSITGFVSQPTLPDRFQVLEHAVPGTLVGKIAPRLTQADPVTYSIVGGNAGGTFYIDTAGNLTVADNQLLDYVTLAAATQYAVQFELFINLTDAVDSSMNETNRRVVVAVQPAAPVVSQQPQDVTAPAGSTISLFLAVEGSVPTQVQWFFNDSPLPGAVNATLVLTNLQTAQAGNYFAALTNWFSATTTHVATVAVTPAKPRIVLDPQSQAAFPGYVVTINSLAVGSEPLAYQWQRNGTDIGGATQAQLRLASISREEAGLYHLIARNSLGQAQSADALIEVVPVAAWGQGFPSGSPLPLELTNTVEVAAGGMFDLALKRDGTVLVWGTTNSPILQASVSGIVAVAAGFDHAITLRSNGTVACWGDNSFAQVQVPLGLNSVIAVAAGANHNLALKTNGQVVAWGSAQFGQTTLPRGLTNIVAIAAGTNHSLALRADGQVIAWGDNTYGQTNTPTNLTDVVAIAAGYDHNLALRQDGTVVAWGNNAYGQASVPPELTNVIAISAGRFNSAALRADGTLESWGAGVANAPASFPNLGQSTPPASATNLAQISCGSLHTVALAGEGAPFLASSPIGRFTGAGLPVTFRALGSGAAPLTYQWQFMGTNIDGATNQLLRLGSVEEKDSGFYTVVLSNTFGTITSQPALLTVTEMPFVIQQPQDQTTWVGGSAKLEVVAGGLPPLSYQWWFSGNPLTGATNPVLTLDDLTFDQQGQYYLIISNQEAVISSQKATVKISQVAAWGIGSGNSDNYNNYGQTSVPGGLTGVVQVAAGVYHSLALKSDGTVVAWGAGTGITPPVQNAVYGQCAVPPGLSRVVAIAAGRYHSLALTEGGTVVAWGAGTTNLNHLPHLGQSQVPIGLSGVIAIAAGDYHSVALKQDGRVVVWGGTSQVTNVPPTAMNVIRISSRGNTIAVLTANGTIAQWGNLPLINVVPNATAIAAGDYSSLTLKADGTLYSWGNIAPPVGLKDLVQISAGYNHALAVKTDGTIVTWGQTNTFSLGVVPRGVSNVIDIAGGQFHSLAALGNRPILIKSQPTDRDAYAGGQTTFTVSVAGAQPIRYQWRFKNTNLLGATNSWLRLNALQQSQAGSYDVVVTNSFGGTTSRVAYLKVLLPVGPALGPPNLVWSSAGDVQWFGQTNVTHDGFQAAQSGRILDNQQSSLQLKILGPGTLTYWWKVSSEQWFDFLNIYLDKAKLNSISGDVDWALQSIPIPSGSHTVTWNYEKDASGSSGLDSGWVDTVVYFPTPPLITTQPFDQTIVAGQPISLSVSATGPGTLTYRWFKDDEVLPSFLSPGLFIGSSTRQDAGRYKVQVSNESASVMSSPASVRVLSPQQLSDSAWMSDGTFRIVSTDAQGIPITVSELSGFQAQVSSNLFDWMVLPGPLWFDNGHPIIIDHDATNFQRRFYRIVEQAP